MYFFSVQKIIYLISIFIKTNHFKFHRRELNAEIVENLITCLFTTCKHFSFESILQICKLGEELIFKLIEIYNHRQATIVIKVI